MRLNRGTHSAGQLRQEEPAHPGDAGFGVLIVGSIGLRVLILGRYLNLSKPNVCRVSINSALGCMLRALQQKQALFSLK